MERGTSCWKAEGKIQTTKGRTAWWQDIIGRKGAGCNSRGCTGLEPRRLTKSIPVGGRAGGRLAGGLGRPLTFIQANCIIPISTRARTQQRSSIFTVNHFRRMKTIRPYVRSRTVAYYYSECLSRKREGGSRVSTFRAWWNRDHRSCQ